MANVRIECGDGRIVHIHGDEGKESALQLANLAKKIVDQIPAAPKTGVGFGSQLIERRGDSPVHGNGNYQRQVDPVTGKGEQ